MASWRRPPAEKDRRLMAAADLGQGWVGPGRAAPGNFEGVMGLVSVLRAGAELSITKWILKIKIVKVNVLRQIRRD